MEKVKQIESIFESHGYTAKYDPEIEYWDIRQPKENDFVMMSAKYHRKALTFNINTVSVSLNNIEDANKYFKELEIAKTILEEISGLI